MSKVIYRHIKDRDGKACVCTYQKRENGKRDMVHLVLFDNLDLATKYCQQTPEYKGMTIVDE